MATRVSAATPPATSHRVRWAPSWRRGSWTIAGAELEDMGDGRRGDAEPKRLDHVTRRRESVRRACGPTRVGRHRPLRFGTSGRVTRWASARC